MLGQTLSDDQAVMASRGTGFCNGWDLLGRDAIGPASGLQGHMRPGYSLEESPRVFLKSICVHMLNSNRCEMRLHGSFVD